MTPDAGAPALPGLTSMRTVRQGKQSGQGTERPYYRLVDGPGEAHLRRLELAPDAPYAPSGRRRSLLHLGYITDIHVLDPASPGRFEFVDRFYGPAALHLLVPAYRPQEILQRQAVEAMIRTLNSITSSPVTAAPVQLLLCTGDHTDNAQWNELQSVLGLMAGGTVALAPQGRGYVGVASAEWGDPAYWHPAPEPDDYKRRWGFPAYPALLDDAARPFQAQGLARPWLTCYGNHDALVQGTARPNTAYERIVTGSGKARALPAGFDPLEHLERFIPHPEAYLAGPTTAVTPDPNRRSYSRREFVQAFAQAAGAPAGHGFGPHNLADGTAYYVYDGVPTVRLIALDTVNTGGHYQGSLGAAQLAWLEQRLSEVHAHYWDAGGRLVDTGQEDRLVVICSHHGLASLTNDLAAPDGTNDLPRVLGPELEALLHRFPNVIVWLNGHIHRNRVTPRPDPAGRTAGFWEVTTSSLLDWPGQARLVEIVANGDGTIAVFCTMVDHAAPADPHAAEGLWRLAAIHRELAANDPHAGLARGAQGDPTDRNVELLLPAPFALDGPGRTPG